MRIRTESNRTFVAACLLDFLLRIQWGIATSLLPIYVHEFGGSPLEVGLVFTVFSVGFTVAQPVWGHLSDVVRRRKPFIVAGMLGLAPIYLVVATQTAPLSLVVGRGSTAIFVGAVVPTMLALLSDISPPEAIGQNRCLRLPGVVVVRRKHLPRGRGCLPPLRPGCRPPSSA
jgi:MFS family permease